jgi:hypothetical protein
MASNASGACSGVLLLALELGVYSFIAPWAPFAVLYPSLVLLPLWLVLVGRLLTEMSPSEREQLSSA